MMRIDRVIHVLGREWKIRFAGHEDQKFAESDLRAYSDPCTREIVINKEAFAHGTHEEEGAIEWAVIRKEIIRAFLWESGLYLQSKRIMGAQVYDVMVDWFAIQHEKLHAAFEEAGALESLNKTIQEKMAELKEEEAKIRLQVWETNVLNPYCCICGQEQPQKSEDDEKTRKKIESLKESIEKMEIRDKFFHQISDAVKSMIFPKETSEGNAE